MSALCNILSTCTKNAVSAPVLPVSSPKTPFRTPFCPFSALIRKNGFSRFSGIFTPKSPLFGFNPAIFRILPTTLIQDKMQNRCK